MTNKEYHKQYYNEYYKEHKEERREYNKINYQTNANERREHRRKYYQKNKNEIQKQSKKYYQNHKEKSHEYNKIYYQNNKVKAQKYYQDHKEKAKIYEQEHKEERQEYRKKRLKNDPNFKLACYLRTRLYLAVRKNQRKGSAVQDLGCTILELKVHLENQFKEGMNWKNHGKWHIDHKIPLISFNLLDREELLKAVHYTNLQPLWAEENRIKGSSLLKT